MGTPLQIIALGEARELLSALRRNRRFGYFLSFTTTSQPAEHPLVKDIKLLRDLILENGGSNGDFTEASSHASLVSAKGLGRVLEPFLGVITSRDASGFITGVALLAVDRIIASLFHLIANQENSDSDSLWSSYAPVLNIVVNDVAACRFDVTDPAEDEVVLARIPSVIMRIATSPIASFLSDASLMRGIEACLGVASGRRRSSELLRRTAELALIEIFSSLASSTPVSSSHSSNGKLDEDLQEESLGTNTQSKPSFAPNKRTQEDGFSEHGPVTNALIAAVLALACRKADPTLSESTSDLLLGLQLLATLLTFGGRKLTKCKFVKEILLRDCSRTILRCVGSFRCPASVITASFTVSRQLVYILDEEATALLQALLKDVYPYYISGRENVKYEPLLEENSQLQAKGQNSTTNIGNLNESKVSGELEIDPVVREIGLEALSDLLSSPGLLSALYQVADCDLTSEDIVGPLLVALGHFSRSTRPRRRSKRLRASSSGSNRASSSGAESDDDDGLVSSSESVESSRFSKSSALLCAESILAVIHSIENRLQLSSDGANSKPAEQKDDVNRKRSVKLEKISWQRAVKAFNESEDITKGSKLIGLLREHGLTKGSCLSDNVEDELSRDIASCVRFMRWTPGVNKAKIGAILGEPDNISCRILAAFTDTFDFREIPFTMSIRVFLSSFRPPLEAQKIDRVLQSFAEHFYEHNRQASAPSGNNSVAEQEASSLSSSKTHSEPSLNFANSEEQEVVALENESNLKGNVDSAGNSFPRESAKIASKEAVCLKPSSSILNSDGIRSPEIVERSIAGLIANADAVHCLTFSVVMLNTDQHNDNVRKKMTLEDFIRNNRGINDKKDFPRWFLAEIFESIAAVEIKTSDDTGAGVISDIQWEGQLSEVFKRRKWLPTSEDSKDFDEDIFSLCWQAAVAAASSTLTEAGDANAAQKSLEGFLSVAHCASAFRQSTPTDAVVSALVASTTLRDGPLHGCIFRFGTDVKAQMAAVALSRVSRQCGDWLRKDGWHSLVSYILRLHALCLLPDHLENYLAGTGSDFDLDGKPLPDSSLIPAWWPSQSHRKPTSETGDEERSKKSSRANNFFSALFQSSIGLESASDEEEAAVQGKGAQREVHKIYSVRVSHSLPAYLKMDSSEQTETQELARKCIASCRIEDILLSEAKVLRSDALQCMTLAFARVACRVLDASGSFPHTNGIMNNSEVTNTPGLQESQEPELPSTDEGKSYSHADPINLWYLKSEIFPASPPHNSSVISGVSTGAREHHSILSEEYRPFSGGSWSVASRDRDERKARDFVVSFCIDVLCDLTLQNRDRLNIPWPALHSVLTRVISPTTKPSALLERAIIALLRVGTRLLHRDELRDDVLRSLNLIVRLPPESLSALGTPIAAGLYNTVKSHGSNISSTSGWHAIFSIIESICSCSSDAVDIGLKLLEMVLTKASPLNAVSRSTFAPLLDAVAAYTNSSSLNASMRAIDLMFHLSQKVPSLLSAAKESDPGISPKDSQGDLSDDDKSWPEYWGPLLKGFARAAEDPRGKIRNHALVALEKIIAIRNSTNFLSGRQWKIAFSNVIFPLMRHLFTTHGLLGATMEAERDAQRKLRVDAGASANGRARSRSSNVSSLHDEQLVRSVVAACNKTRLRAVLLMSKAFLQHHAVMGTDLPADEFTDLWLGVLEIFRVAWNGGSSEADAALQSIPWAREVDILKEHVPENVKNLLLVLCDCGLLSKSDPVRWNATFALLQGFMPEDMESFVSIAAPVPNDDGGKASIVGPPQAAVVPGSEAPN